jgi:hypothetical protein
LSDALQSDANRRLLVSAQEAALAGRMATARESLAQLWPTISAGIESLPDLDSVNIYSGIGLALLKGGNPDQARKYARLALVFAPTDILAHALYPLSDRILLGRSFINHHQIQKAIDLMATIQSLQPDDEAGFYLHLLQYFEAEKIKARTLAPLAGRATLFCLPVWGRKYIDKLLRTAIPSLLAPGNVPALAAKDPVIFDIYTTQTDRARLETAPEIQALAAHARIEYTIIPPEFIAFQKTENTQDPDRLFFAGMNYLSAVKAKALGADLGFAGPEALYSDRFYGTAKEYLRAGYQAVLISSLRARDDKLAAYLDRHEAVTGHSIEINAKRLVEYTVENLNPNNVSMFIRSDNQPIGQDVIALYFKTATGFVGHSYQISPILIGHSIIPENLEFDYVTFDARLLAECSRGQDPEEIYKVIDNPAAEIFFTDLDSASDGTARVFGQFPVSVEQCVESALKWCHRASDFSFFSWAFQKRFEFLCDSSHLPESNFVESEAVTAFLAQFRAAQDEKIQVIDFFSTRRQDGS